ncbi:MAG TPA: LysM peptidoglycan-binding domain-containing protein, partial [Anaerolineales bacterium]|nr:LysM peptidoglycan-binding domain-containing protein [Anaerolineales bacterium]
NTLRPIAFIGGLALLVLFLSWIFGAIPPNSASENATPNAFGTSDGEQNTNGEATAPRITSTPTGESTAIPTSTPTLAASPTPVSYIVQDGDTCLAISAFFNISVQSLIQTNALDSQCTIFPRDVLFIPQPTPTPGPTLNATEQYFADCEKVVYTVQEGDTLSIISANYQVPMDAIRRWNNLSVDTVFERLPLTIPLCERNTPPTGGSLSSLPSIRLIPNVTFDLAVPFPESSSLTLYQQQLDGPLTEDAVRQMANQMGLNGEITSSPGEGGDTIYTVTDGDLQMIFFGFPSQFSYFLNTPPATGDPLPFDPRVAFAEDFLNAHGLLIFPYRAEPSPTDPNGVRFVQLLDGVPLNYGIGENPGLMEWITVSVDPAGLIHSLFHSRHTFQPVGDTPLLTAEQAWERLAQPNAESRARYAILAAPMTWTRSAPEHTETVTGYLDNENNGATFYADDGRVLTLPDLPADMPLYPILEIQGIVTEDTLDWSAITLSGGTYRSSLSCGGGGGGGGGFYENANFGGGNFGFVTLDPLAPSNPPGTYVSPIQPGDAVEGVQGTLYIIHRLYTDGKEANEYNFWFAGDETTPGWTAFLEGDALAGTESLQNLPIKVWGTVTRLDANGLPILAVDRYEEAYPGMRIQAWLGTQQIVPLGGQQVVLYTTQAGAQYVLQHSIQYGADASLVGTPGDTVIIEGYLLPESSFGGYLVLNELSAGMDNNRTDLSDYIITSSLIDIQDDSNGYVDPATTLTGHVTIENIELMYTAISLDRCTPDFANNPDFASWLYVQPIWRFTGHFDDGRSFEVQVQALPDEYLR